nr:polymorphic toxin-type HINT domain-containing protein [Phytohabitans flavus]
MRRHRRRHLPRRRRPRRRRTIRHLHHPRNRLGNRRHKSRPRHRTSRRARQGLQTRQQLRTRYPRTHGRRLHQTDRGRGSRRRGRRDRPDHWPHRGQSRNGGPPQPRPRPDRPHHLAPWGGASVLHTTAEHPFWSLTRNSWVNASQLLPGEHARTSDGQTATITAVRNFVAARHMHNLTVADIHTYYVLAGNIPVLVHNDPMDPLSFGQGYTGRMDTFVSRGGNAGFEIHVYHRGSEVGIFGSQGFFNKHGLTGAPEGMPTGVYNTIRDTAITKMRAMGVIKPKGHEDVTGDKWKRPLPGDAC